MRYLSWIAATTIALWFVSPAEATVYNFDVLYTGGGNASLVAGSDDPVGTTLVAGDSFGWTISADGDGAWQVVTGGGFFPLMAFYAAEPGRRFGDFTLTLLNNGVNVFTTSEVGAENAFVHVGTNTINLGTGLVFDQMHLDYVLNNAIDDPQFGGDPDNPMPIGTTLQGLLPIFGPPELNSFSPGIIYTGAVPEPQSIALLFAGAGMIWLAASRRRAA